MVSFLLVLIELFSIGVTAEALGANIGSKSAISLQRKPVDPKCQVEGVAPTNHLSSSDKTRLNDLVYGIRIWTDLSSVLSQSTRLTVVYKITTLGHLSKNHNCLTIKEYILGHLSKNHNCLTIEINYIIKSGTFTFNSGGH